jgi:hypothetical protein
MVGRTIWIILAPLLALSTSACAAPQHAKPTQPRTNSTPPGTPARLAAGLTLPPPTAASTFTPSLTPTLNASSTVTATRTATPSPTPTPTLIPVALHTPVRNLNLRVTVLSVERKPDAQNVGCDLVSVTFKVEGLQVENASFDAAWVTLVDDQGRKPLSFAVKIGNGQFNIVPGVRLSVNLAPTFTYIFQVPSDASGLLFLFEDLPPVALPKALE